MLQHMLTYMLCAVLCNAAAWLELLAVVTSLIMLLFMIMVPSFPESPQWLLAIGRKVSHHLCIAVIAQFCTLWLLTPL